MGPWDYGIDVGRWDSPWPHGNAVGPRKPHGPMGFPWAHGNPMGPLVSYVPMAFSWAHGTPMGPW